MVRFVGLAQSGSVGRMIRIEVRGAKELARDLDPRTSEFDKILRSALLASAVIVEAAAKKKVHSPDNPWINPDRGYSIATGKLQASIGIGGVEGSGLDLSVRVGHPHGKAGAGMAGMAFGRLTDSGRRTRKGKIIGVHTGGPKGREGRVNKADPVVYGPIEDKRHPFFGVSLQVNQSRIRELIDKRISAYLAQVGRRR